MDRLPNPLARPGPTREPSISRFFGSTAWPLAHARVGPVVVAASPDKTTLALRMPIEAGPVHRIAPVDVAGKLLGPKKQHVALLSSQEGAVASRTTIMKDLQAIRD